MKNVFTQLYQRNPIANLFKELYFPLKSKTISEFSSVPIPTTITTFFEIIAQHFDQAYKERVLILSSSFPSNSLDILAFKPNDSRFKADLEKFAKERGLYQLKNESDIQFQSRIIYAHRFLLTSPTLLGLTDIITNIVPQKFIIRELYTESWILGDNDSNKDTSLKRTSLGIDTILGNNFESYYFVVDFKGTGIELEQKTYLENVINLYKPAHAGFHINAFLKNETKPEVNTYLNK